MISALPVVRTASSGVVPETVELERSSRFQDLCSLCVPRGLLLLLWLFRLFDLPCLPGLPCPPSDPSGLLSDRLCLVTGRLCHLYLFPDLLCRLVLCLCARTWVMCVCVYMRAYWRELFCIPPPEPPTASVPSLFLSMGPGKAEPKSHTHSLVEHFKVKASHCQTPLPWPPPPPPARPRRAPATTTTTTTTAVGAWKVCSVRCQDVCRTHGSPGPTGVWEAGGTGAVPPDTPVWCRLAAAIH